VTFRPKRDVFWVPLLLAALLLSLLAQAARLLPSLRRRPALPAEAGQQFEGASMAWRSAALESRSWAGI
jgi:hypothetical protein